MEKDWDFDYTIKDSYKPEYQSSTVAIHSTTFGNSTGDWHYDTTNYPTYYYTWPWYPTTVYMYQIFCPRPRCKGVFWGEIDKIATCPKCSARVKIINEPPPDYEVEVTK